MTTELPLGWEPITLGQIGDLHCGQSPSSRTVNREGNGTPYVTGPEQWDGKSIRQGKWTTDPKRIVPEGCIFVTVKGAGVGTTFPGIACAIGRDIYAYQPSGKVSFGFVHEALQFTIQDVLLHARGDIPGLSRGHIVDHEIGLPPLNEQRRIVAKIEALMARSAWAKEALDAIPALLDRYRQSVLAAAFRGDLTADWRSSNNPTPISKTLQDTPTPQQPRGGRQATATVIPGVGGMAVNNPQTPLPKGWSWVPLLRVARQETGHTPSRGKRKYWSGDVPWIGIRDAGDHHGGIIQDTKQHVTQEGLANSSARLLPARTVCLSRTASVGYVVMMGRDMTTSQDFATWTCTKALYPSFLMYALLSEGNEIRRFGKGSTHTTIYFPEIRAFHVALAPVEEQREIVRRVQWAFTTIKAVEDQARQVAKTLPSLDQSILAKAFRGELVPQDPNDEPASVLLARIKAERAANGSPPRGRRKSASMLVL